MEEQLVSNNLLKILFEKGFLENGLSYSTDRKVFRYTKSVTQSIAQKWLRDVHKIYVTPLPTYMGDDVDKKHYFEISYGKHLKQMGDKYGYFNTYEEALEMGIFEALQLIKDETTNNPIN